MSDMSEYLESTDLINFEHPDLQKLIRERNWRSLSPYDAIGAVYLYVRDEIAFGYNADDRLPAHQVLNDGYGQCNTKGTLLMALLRALDIPSRFHGFTIFNELQRGAIPNYLMFLAPKRIIHSWIEVYFEGRWINLEGFIIDLPFLQQIQTKFADDHDDFSGFGIATKCLLKPQNDWNGCDTYIQKEGIADDFGVFTHPDDFYKQYGTNLKGLKKWLFRWVVRHLMNRNVRAIRTKGIA